MAKITRYGRSAEGNWWVVAIDTGTWKTARCFASFREVRHFAECLGFDLHNAVFSDYKAGEQIESYD